MGEGRRRWVAFFGLWCLYSVATIGTANADVKIERVRYKGWSDCWKLSNGTVELVLVPAVSRILHYGFKGGPNLLWENRPLAGTVGDGKTGDWRNVGGDKVWPWPQDDWERLLPRAWPPPPVADALPVQVTVVGKDTLRTTSDRLMPWGVRILREIRMEPTGTGVHIVSRFVRETDGEVAPCAPWTVTQVPATPWVIARLLPASTLPDGYKSFSGEAKFKSVTKLPEGVLLVERNPTQATKIGFDGDILATLQADTLFLIRQAKSLPADHRGGAWAPGDRAQLYSQPDDANAAKAGTLPYIELEMTAPRKSLKKGETVTLAQFWELRRLPEPQRNPSGVAVLLKSL
ncbi:MAG: hypothetical protein SFU56_07355 [Capsulimonadales bacterium]|nr:hypothetical protein [Capsulimonadales bacterium]